MGGQSWGAPAGAFPWGFRVVGLGVLGRGGKGKGQALAPLQCSRHSPPLTRGTVLNQLRYTEPRQRQQL